MFLRYTCSRKGRARRYEVEVKPGWYFRIVSRLDSQKRTHYQIGKCMRRFFSFGSSQGERLWERMGRLMARYL